jgi:YidC/Oxa1 family membrane protein insertase
MPVFLSFFVALKSLGTRFPDVSAGGALWFTDLSAADPYFLLPILSSATFLLTMELGTG